jgi:hypothetical protein
LPRSNTWEQVHLTRCPRHGNPATTFAAVRDWLWTAVQRADPPGVPLRFQVGDAACVGLFGGNS